MTSPPQPERIDRHHRVAGMPLNRRASPRRSRRARWWACHVLLLLLCLLVPAGGVAAAERTPPLRDYAVDMWTSRNGLPHNSLRGIAQTPEGHLWFATWEGVARYNGLDFELYDRSTTPGLLDNGIGALYVDRDGALWVTDSRGNVLRRTLDGRWRQWPQQPPAPQVLIQGMQKDSKGRLWLLYEGRGLGYMSPEGRFVYEAPPPGAPVNMTLSNWLAVDDRDRVWVGTMDGLRLRGDDGVLGNAPARLGLPPGSAWPYRAPDGALWIVAEGALYRMQDEGARRVHTLPGISHTTAMLQDRHGDLWLGTENQGLFRIGSRGVEHLPENRQVRSGRIASLFEDAEGSIWVGGNGGLYRLRETLFSNYTTADGLSGDYVRAVMEDDRQRLWVGSAAGLDRMERDGRIVPVPLRNSVGRAPSVLSLAQSRDGAVWAGTFGDGIYRIDRDGRSRHYGTAEGLAAGNVRVMSADRDGNGIWAGTQRGLVRITDDGVRVPTTPGLPGGLVTALLASDDGLWVGTIEGIRVLRGNTVQRLDVDGLGGGRSIFGFTPVGDAMWITSDRGLYRYRDGQLARVGLEQGMPVDTVFEMVPDRLGNVWISSNRGVLRTTLAALDDVADGRSARIEVERYNEIDGMHNAQANGSTGPSATLRGDGTYWVATAGGLSMVDPARLQHFRERLPPPVVVESVQLDGVPLHWQEQDVTRVPGGQRVTVGYVGLSYLMSDRIRYRTRLEGLDRGWIERGNQRSVEFIGLPPGNYTLHVSAMHPGGRWSESEAAWSFTVEPLLWQRRSVQAVAGVLLLLALVALYRYLIHRYKTSNIRLARQVDERTADLQLQAERLLAANQEKTALAERLRQQAEAFERQAHEDPLTGLPNRRAFDEGLARDFARSQRSGHPLSLLVLDIDHFKTVNDTWSHSVGDQVLCEVGRLLAASCRDSDLPARLGGEEFALLLNDTALDEAQLVCARLQGLFHAQRNWAGIEGLRVTFSAGLVQLGAGDRAPLLLFQRADKALYQAKSDGRDRICLG
ncbi:ligand-binding sensor domain-containing diguanylate cyclase [Stenotrophomonas sp. MYb238]|uniref:ligand-binding sensor domain-containing diguanylate cyclase n=1 Tax=Stenotrophomonas sp. MYb238 TaxID=2040281 RepID=UPI001D177736|nr:ligand-binding sensor domain-containing diguanylate cyclase [Stenotrophomonas sp. MYb238]